MRIPRAMQRWFYPQQDLPRGSMLSPHASGKTVIRMRIKTDRWPGCREGRQRSCQGHLITSEIGAVRNAATSAFSHNCLLGACSDTVVT
jgi:hypothetical protein